VEVAMAEVVRAVEVMVEVKVEEEMVVEAKEAAFEKTM